MAGLFVLVTIFVVIAGMVLLFRNLIVRIGSWSQAYQGLAKRYGTKVSYSRNRPKLTFRYGDSNCVLSNVGRSNHRRTQLKVSWLDRKLKLFVSTFGEPVGIIKAWSLQPVSLEAESNGRFVVYCNDVAIARKIINATTRWQIEQLIDLGGESGIEIFLSSGQLKITKPGFIKHNMILDDFVRFGLELFDQLKLALNDDLEFVPQTEPLILEDVICPICTDKIHHDFVTCVRCRTPHCADCWEYNGQCATFACNETRFLRIGEAQKSSLG